MIRGSARVAGTGQRGARKPLGPAFDPAARARRLAPPAPARAPCARAGRGHLRQRGRADPAQPLAGRLLRRDRAKAHAGVRDPAPGLRGDRRRLLVLVVAQTWLQEMIKVRLREWLTHDLLDQWLVPKRAYLLGFAGQIGVNPDQRIHQDAQHLTELTTILAIGLLQASLLLVELRRRALGALGAGRVRRTATATASPSRATWSGARSPIRSAARCSPGGSAGR